MELSSIINEQLEKQTDFKKLTLEQFTEAYNEYLQNQEKSKTEIVFYSPVLENEINKTILELLYDSERIKEKNQRCRSTKNNVADANIRI